MQNHRVFKAGLAKQALGWFVFLGAAVALAALIYAVYMNLETQTAADLWSAVAIGVFLAGLMAGGVVIQRQRWSIEGETILFHHLFGTKTIPVSGLAGYGKLIISVSAFPLAHVDLYDSALKPVIRLPVTFGDLPRAEAWFAERLRYVVNDGSAALPKRRFADTPKI